MKRAEMAGAIFEVLGGILSATEFRLKKSEDGFARKISGGKQVLGVPLWDYHPDFEFSLNICIRLDAVEATFHRFSGSPANYHRMSFTMTARLEQFTGNPPRYKVRSVEDAAYRFSGRVGAVSGAVPHISIKIRRDGNRDAISIRARNRPRPGFAPGFTPLPPIIGPASGQPVAQSGRHPFECRAARE